jgi:hypothetical protein
MSTDFIFDPAVWITVFAFVSVVVYFYWRQKVKNQLSKAEQRIGGKHFPSWLVVVLSLLAVGIIYMLFRILISAGIIPTA